MRESPTPYCSRGLSRRQAADYIGATQQEFDRMVAAGEMPRPARIGGFWRWDKLAVDRAFEAIFAAQTKSPDEGVIEFGAGPSITKRLSIAERRLLPNWGLSETDPTTWLTEEEAAIWMEEYRQQRKKRLD